MAPLAAGQRICFQQRVLALSEDNHEAAARSRRERERESRRVDVRIAVEWRETAAEEHRQEQEAAANARPDPICPLSFSHAPQGWITSTVREPVLHTAGLVMPIDQGPLLSTDLHNLLRQFREFCEVTDLADDDDDDDTRPNTVSHKDDWQYQVVCDMDGGCFVLCKINMRRDAPAIEILASQTARTRDNAVLDAIGTYCRSLLGGPHVQVDVSNLLGNNAGSTLGVIAGIVFLEIWGDFRRPINHNVGLRLLGAASCAEDIESYHPSKPMRARLHPEDVIADVNRHLPEHSERLEALAKLHDDTICVTRLLSQIRLKVDNLKKGKLIQRQIRSRKLFNMGVLFKQDLPWYHAEQDALEAIIRSNGR